jgi:hypothetical protein
VAGSVQEEDAYAAGDVDLATRHPSLHPSWWMEEGDGLTLSDVSEFGGFINDGGRTLTTWTGVKLADVTSLVRIERYTPSRGYVGVTTVRAVDAHGQEWYGRSPGVGMYAHMRRRT